MPCMGSPELEMSLEQVPIPVLINKTQMNGEHGGSQCGLTSLLPMSCRGRAAAFARDLHSRLRSLSASGEEDESTWLKPPNAPTTRDHDTFYDFELECESPSSPIDEVEHPNFPERSPSKEELPFYDGESEPDPKSEKKKNGLRFSTSFFTDNSPVKRQPAPRQNGHDKRLFSPITFEGCARQNSLDEIDCSSIPSTLEEADRLSIPSNLGEILDSDPEFESAKSEPESVDEVSSERSMVEGVAETIENLSLLGVDVPNEEEDETISIELPEEVKEIQIETCPKVDCPAEIVTSEEHAGKESSSSPECEIELGEEVKVDEDDHYDDRPQRLRRCSSLKTGKTPPGTPGRKKIVRFADVLGLDLADVKTFMDEIPVIPKSAYDDLTGCDVACSPPSRPPQRFGALTLVPLFQLPKDVSDKLDTQNVCLESARVCDGVHVTVCGSVRVRNLDFHKTVHVRYSMNGWKTFTDLQANYVQGSCDGYSDKFQFVLYAPCLTSGQRLEIAVRFQCKGRQYWDNNNGMNYKFDCLDLGAMAPSPSSSAPLHPTTDWHPSFY